MTDNNAKEKVNSLRAKANFLAAQAFYDEGKEKNIAYAKKLYEQLGEVVNNLDKDSEMKLISQTMGGLINITYCIENIETYSEVNYPDWEKGANMMRFIIEERKKS